MIVLLLLWIATVLIATTHFLNALHVSIQAHRKKAVGFVTHTQKRFNKMERLNSSITHTIMRQGKKSKVTIEEADLFTFHSVGPFLHY